MDEATRTEHEANRRAAEEADARAVLSLRAWARAWEVVLPISTVVEARQRVLSSGLLDLDRPWARVTVRCRKCGAQKADHALGRAEAQQGFVVHMAARGLPCGHVAASWPPPAEVAAAWELEIVAGEGGGG